MSKLSRRQLIPRVGKAALAGIASVKLMPAFAQTREVSMLGWNHFVPASDVKLKELIEKFSKETGISVRSDHVAQPQLLAQQAAERQAESGHDIMLFLTGQDWRYRDYLVDLDDVVSDLNKQYGDNIYSFMKDGFVVEGHWKVLPFSWTGYLGNYLHSKFAEVGESPPKTWADLLRAGKKLKEIAHPVGIPISHCQDANATFWAICWSFGARVLEADGKTISLSSPAMHDVIDYYKELHAIMEPEVLSWDDLANNRCINSSHCAWVYNPVSSYLAAVDNKLPIANDLNHHPTLAGPAGQFSATLTYVYGIWKFSRNVQAAKELLRFLFREHNLREWIQAGAGFSIPMWRYWEGHPVWATDPKLKMLPAEGPYGRLRGWPAPPSEAVGLIDDLYILPDMIAKAIGGMPTTSAISWATDNVAQILDGRKSR